MPIDVKPDEEKRLLRVTISGAWPTLPEIVAERSRLILEGFISRANRHRSKALMTSATAS